MKCPNCGKEVAHDAMFCSSCGTRIERNDVFKNQDQPFTNTSSYNSSNSNEGKSKNSCLEKFLTILFCVFIVIFCIRYCDNIKGLFDFGPFKTLTMSEEEKFRNATQEVLDDMQLPIKIMEGATLSQAYLQGNSIYYICTINGVTPQMLNVTEEVISELKGDMATMVQMLFKTSDSTDDYFKLFKKYGYIIVYKYENEYGTELFKVTLTADDLTNTRSQKRSQSSMPTPQDKYSNSSSSNQRVQNQSTSKDQEESELRTNLLIEIVCTKSQLPIKIEEGLTITSFELNGKSICTTVRIDASNSSLDKETANLLRTGLVQALKQSEDKDRLLKMKKYGYYYLMTLINKNNKQLAQFSIMPSELL